MLHRFFPASASGRGPATSTPLPTSANRYPSQGPDFTQDIQQDATFRPDTPDAPSDRYSDDSHYYDTHVGINKQPQSSMPPPKSSHSGMPPPSNSYSCMLPPNSSYSGMPPPSSLYSGMPPPGRGETPQPGSSHSTQPHAPASAVAQLGDVPNLSLTFVPRLTIDLPGQGVAAAQLLQSNPVLHLGQQQQQIGNQAQSINLNQLLAMAMQLGVSNQIGRQQPAEAVADDVTKSGYSEVQPGKRSESSHVTKSGYSEAHLGKRKNTCGYDPDDSDVKRQRLSPLVPDSTLDDIASQAVARARKHKTESFSDYQHVKKPCMSSCKDSSSIGQWKSDTFDDSDYKSASARDTDVNNNSTRPLRPLSPLDGKYSTRPPWHNE